MNKGNQGVGERSHLLLFAWRTVFFHKLLSQILGFLYLMTSLISALIFFSSLTASSTTFPSTFSLSILNSHLFQKKGPCFLDDKMNSHLSKTSLVSTLLSTTTSFFTLPCTNQSLICARMSLRNFWTWNIQLMERSQVERKEKYALSSVETKRVRPYSCFLVKLSGG